MTKLKLNNDVQLTNLKTSKLKNIHYLKFHKFSFRKFCLVTYLLICWLFLQLSLVFHTPEVVLCMCQTTVALLATASDIHRQVPTYMADMCHDWLTNQNTDCCFVVIGLSTKQPTVLAVLQTGPSSLLAPSVRHIIRGQYGIQKNIYIHLCVKHMYTFATET